MRFFVCVLLLTGASMISPALGQRVAFVPGYIVTPEADTLSGQIATALDRDIVHGVTFRASADAPPQQFRPDELLAYGFTGGRRFVSREVELRGAEPQARFLQVLVEGAASLLVLLHPDDLFFLEGEEIGFEPLQPAVRTRVEGSSAIRQSWPYISTLARSFSACPEVVERLVHAAPASTAPQAGTATQAGAIRGPRVLYDAHSLTRVVREYNACMGSPSQEWRIERRVASRVGVRAGVGTAQLTSRVFDRSEPRLVPFVGVFGEFSFPRMPPRLALTLEGTYQQKGLGDEQYFSRTPSGRSPVEIEHFDRSYLAGSVGVRYHLSESTWQPSVAAGLVSGLMVGGGKTPLKLSTTEYLPPAYDSGVYAELGMARPFNRYGDVVMGLRFEFTNAGEPFPLLLFSPMDTFYMRNLSYVVVTGIRF